MGKHPTIIVTDEDRMYKCTGCGKKHDIYDMGYIGPKNRDDMTCSPYAEWEQLCQECEDKREEA